MRKQAFYAAEDGRTYDAVIDLVVPLYALFHETVVRIAKRTVAPEKPAFMALDIGVGSGAEAIALLKECPEAKIVAIDQSEPMRDRYVENYHRVFGCNPESDGRSVWVTGDFLAEESKGVLIEAAKSNGGRYDLVISGFTLHHFADLQKRVAYQRAFELLGPGGVLINLDLFTFDAPVMACEGKSFDYEWISNQFRSPDPSRLVGVEITGIRSTLTIPQDEREKLREKWLEHHANDNLLEPMTVQLEMLRQIGFRDCEAPMRFWHTGILFGRKP